VSGLALIVAAGGYGRRLGAGGPKQYVSLLGVPMLERTVQALASCDEVTMLVVVVNAEDVAFCRDEVIGDRYPAVVDVVAGGPERALSVRNGLRALAARGGADLVGTHDGARPLVSCAEIRRLRERIEADTELAGAILAVPSTDTLKAVDAAGLITATPARAGLWRALTPQVFRWKPFVVAYEQPDDVLAKATDDAALVEAMGGLVGAVEGSPENLKVTTPVDVRLAELLLRERGSAAGRSAAERPAAPEHAGAPERGS
jgi:2-C-methyl-D-erythritol 4-phosphate cytidylyltransferase